MTARNFMFAVLAGALAAVLGEVIKREIFQSET